MNLFFSPRGWRAGLFLLLSAFLVSAHAASFRAVVGDVRIQRGDQFINAVVGTRLREGDEVLTDGAGEAVVSFEDGARMAVRADSVVTITELKLKGVPEKRRKSIKTVKGSLRYISGRYGKRQYIAFQTNTATIGVRGTDIEIVVVEEPVGEDLAGTYLKVNRGAATLQALDGTRVDVDPGEVAFGGEPDLMPRGPGGVKRPAGRKLQSPGALNFRAGQLDNLMK